MIKPIVQRLALKSPTETLRRVVLSLPSPLSLVGTPVFLGVSVPPTPTPALLSHLRLSLSSSSPSVTTGLDRLRDSYLFSERKGDVKSTASFLTKATGNKKISTLTSKGLASINRCLVTFKAVTDFWPPALHHTVSK